MVEMQRANPWSAALFSSPKIRRVLGDATELLPAVAAASFDAVLHDPPTAAMSGELYSEAFYRELARILRPGGALFHYIGDPTSQASGKLFRGVAARLRDAGFDAVRTNRDAFGITAVAGRLETEMD